MSMTYIQAINAVIRRLREETVTASTNSPFATFVGDMVNDTINEIQDKWQWNSLRSEIEITTSSGTDIYNVTGSNQESFILGDRIFDATNDYDILRYPYDDIKRRQLYTTSSATTISWFREVGFDTSNDELKVEFYPEVTGIYSLTVPCYVPHDEISTDSTLIKLPRLPVIYGAWSRCVSERGEDGGATTSEVNSWYFKYLQDAIVRDQMRYSKYENDWKVT